MGLVDQLAGKKDIIEHCLKLAEDWGKKDRLSYSIMKKEIWKEEIELLFADDIYHEPFDRDHPFYMFKTKALDPDAQSI
jgi:hypothetical protein